MSCNSKSECWEEPHLCCWPNCQSAESRKRERDTSAADDWSGSQRTAEAGALDRPERPLRGALTGSTEMSQTCPICGETSPEPAEICIPKLVGTAEHGKPCSYSVEGGRRFAEAIGEEKAALINAISASGALVMER